MKALTKDEFRETLKGKPNKLAEKAIASIKAQEPLRNLKELVEAGCPFVFYQRDPRRPRSSYTIAHVLDACFESHLGVVQEKEKTEENGVTMQTAVIGGVHHSQGREEHFDYLLSLGFTPGTNSWRGGLFSHIMNCCFYQDDPERRESARKFAKILVKHGKIDPNFYAKNNYQWIGKMENLKFLIELGADPTRSEMIECALRYLACSTSQGETHQSRIEVIKALLAAGAVPVRFKEDHATDDYTRLRLEQGGLMPIFLKLGLINPKDSEKYTEFKNKLQKEDPRRFNFEI